MWLIVEKYAVQHIQKLVQRKGLCFVGIEDLKDFYPLSIYNVFGQCFVVLKHRICLE